MGEQVRGQGGPHHAQARPGARPRPHMVWWHGGPLGHPRWLSAPFYAKTSNINFLGFFEKLYFSDFSRN